ncbi:MAG: hypothetical protein CMJ59_11660 [Planctomycetaceae bacterium]|nr:hypothetical protein [Planctomycetaceae bacterium]
MSLISWIGGPHAGYKTGASFVIAKQQRPRLGKIGNVTLVLKIGPGAKKLIGARKIFASNSTAGLPVRPSFDVYKYF